jgi:competence protein ComEC
VDWGIQRGVWRRLRAALGRSSGAAVLAWLSQQLVAETARWGLWLPVCVGSGIAAYFALETQPPWFLAVALGLVAAGLCLVGWRRSASQPALLPAGLALGLAAAGFALAQWRTAAVAAPVLERRLGPVLVSGHVVAVEPGDRRWRLTFERPRIERIAADATPVKLRVSLAMPADPIRPGDHVEVKAMLSPPPEPAVAGAYDFARSAWFRQLGGVGFAVGPPRVSPAAPDGGAAWGPRYELWLAQSRHDMTARIVAALPGPSGAVAAALMTGERAAIPESVEAAFRDSGLQHILSISGLHLALVTGVLFFMLRGGLALSETIALRYPIKKWAAVAALAGAFAYLELSGRAVPTQRAFLMAAMVLIAVLIDRTAISMRTVAWAAAAVLAVAPESVLDASFQMSFAAVVALIAIYESLGERMGEWRAGAGIVRRAGLYVGLTALTTLVAATATAPYAAYHFNRFVDFGLIANLIAVPITSLWVMPWAVVAFALMPLSLESWALAPMGIGVDWVIAVAEMVAGWPGAVAPVPAMPYAGLALVTGGGLWLCLWQRPWRWFGLIAVAAGSLSPWLGSGPDILVDGEARSVAVKAESGELLVRAPGAFPVETWLRRAGQKSALPWPKNGASDDGRLRCDELGCVYRAGGYLVSLPKSERALGEACWRADVVIATFPVRGRCAGAKIVIDRFDLWRQGSHALWLDADRPIRVVAAQAARGERPWVRPRVSRRQADQRRQAEEFRKAEEMRQAEEALNTAATGPQDDLEP